MTELRKYLNRTSGQVALIAASSREHAIALAADFAAIFGLDPRWIATAPEEVIDLSKPRLACWIESCPVTHAAGRVEVGRPELWRFAIPRNRWLASPTVGGLSVSDVLVLVVAPTAGEAVRVLQASAAAFTPEEADRAMRTAEAAPAPVPISLAPGVLAWGEK